MSEDLAYILSVFAYLIGTGLMAGALWLGIEGVYWLYCKATGREY